MLGRILWRQIWSASLLVGLCLLTISCGASSPALAVASPTPTPPPLPTLTPSPTPTATISPTATETSAVSVGCSTGTAMYFENPPGPLPTTIPFPPGTLVLNSGLGINAFSAQYALCTPGATQAAITTFMDSALPAAGWTNNKPQGCTVNFPPDEWYKGIYGIEIVFQPSAPPHQWVLVMDFLNIIGYGCAA